MDDLKSLIWVGASKKELKAFPRTVFVTSKRNMAGNESMSKLKFEKGSGNVFADLGFPDSQQELLKARLTYEIYKIIEKRKLTQQQAAEVLDISQSYVSDLKRNRSGRFSVGKLMQFLNALDMDVEVKLKKHPARSKDDAGISVST